MKTPITWYGGKQRMAKHILPLIPEHTTYTESFFGGGAIFFLKDPVGCEVINDLNREAINFYSTIVKDFEALQLEIQSTLRSRSSFDDAKLMLQHPHLFNELQRAWAFYTVSHQSFASDMSTFGYSLKPETNLPKRNTNKKNEFDVEFKIRLENTNIECEDAISVITRYDTVDTFHYVDPPYFNSECKFYSGYGIEEF